MAGVCVGAGMFVVGVCMCWGVVGVCALWWVCVCIAVGVCVLWCGGRVCVAVCWCGGCMRVVVGKYNPTRSRKWNVQFPRNYLKNVTFFRKK